MDDNVGIEYNKNNIKNDIKNDIKNNIIAITTYCDNKEKIDILNDNIDIIRDRYSSFNIAIHANYPLPEYIQRKVDHYFFEDLNITFNKKNYYWQKNAFFNKKFTYEFEDYGFCVLLQLKSIVKYLIDYKRVMFINYDIVLKSEYFENFYNYYKYDLVTYMFDRINNNKIYLILMYFDPKILSKDFLDIISQKKYKSDSLMLEEKIFNYINEIDINFKILDGGHIKDKINHDFAYRNNYFEKCLILHDNGELKIYLWNFYPDKNANSITLLINNNEEFIVDNLNENGAFENVLEYNNNIFNIKITKINNEIVIIPLNVLYNDTVSVDDY